MAKNYNYCLHFSVGELSCQLLRAISSLQSSTWVSPTNYFTHKHPFVEMHYIASGGCSYSSGNVIYEANPGQLLLIPPDTEHLLKQVTHSPQRLILSIYIQPPPGRMPSPSRTLYNALHSSAPVLLDAPPNSTLAEALNHISLLTSEDEQAFSVRESMRAYATLLLAALSELLAESSVSTFTPPSQTFAPQSFLIDQFFYYPSAMKGGAPALAARLNVSPRQLDRILLETCGMNFREKLNQTKLNYAMDLLTNQDLSIAQIAHLLDYSTSTAFGAFIKKATGQTPSQLRRALRPGIRSL